jgi:hypothetical protein
VRPTSLYDSGGGAHISQSHPPEPAPLGFREVFAKTSFKDRNLFACSQARLVNNLNDGMRWGVFPLFFATFGLGVERIGILKAVYPAVWGTLQVATGPLSDHWGRKGLIVFGMWVQAAGIFATVATRDFGWWWADPVGALAMLPVILWQGQETFEEAREEEAE